MFANVLDKFLPRPLLKTENLPSFARVFVTEQPGRRIVHILSYVSELRGEKTEMIEEAIPVLNAKLAIRLDGHCPIKIYLAPEGKELPFTMGNDYICVDVPAFKNIPPREVAFRSLRGNATTC